MKPPARPLMFMHRPQLVSVYIPSACLLTISLFTGFIENKHFEANIMVHLTTMLVMYTLFQVGLISSTA